MIATYLVLLVALIGVSAALLIYSDNWDTGWHMLASIIGVIGAAASVLASIAGLFLAFGWSSAAYQAELINREYGTNYSQAEVFYASNVIDTVRHLDRKRIELSGDLLKDK